MAKSSRPPGHRGQRALRIDDSLVERHEARRTIETVLRRRVQSVDDAEVKRVAREIRRLSPQAEETLLDIYLADPGELGHSALLMLSEMPHEKADRRLDALLARRGMSDKELTQLLTAKAFLQGVPEDAFHVLAQHGDPQELMLRITGQMWEKFSAEEAAALWIEQFAKLEPGERATVLDLFLQKPCPSLLGIARVEARSGDRAIELQIAERLADFPYPGAVALLEELGRSPHIDARLAADHSLAALRRKAPELASIDPKGDWNLGGGQFYEAYTMEDPLEGQFIVIYSRQAADGLIRFCSALIDSWDRGLVDMWGGVNHSKEEFQDVAYGGGMKAGADDADEPAVDAEEGPPEDGEAIDDKELAEALSFLQRAAKGKAGEDRKDSRDFAFEDAEDDEVPLAHSDFVEAAPEYVVFLLRAAEDLSRRRGYPLPLTWRVWRDLYAAEPVSHEDFAVKFGKTCAGCGNDVRPGTKKSRKSAPAVFDSVVLCPSCLAAKNRCADCGRKIDPMKAMTMVDRVEERVEFFCDRCGEKRNQEES
ncbi:MAG: hypothetical protein NTW86_31800 [Candidatus Sumerlaeota bacterium]|nr:hypothetical protein [Candidatus Sumerlaeota bacterium]